MGSTGTTAIDPVARIGELARAHGAWLHVDAAMAGTAMACPSCAGCGTGSSRPTRWSWNPHKWLGIGFDCTAYHVRDPDHLVRVMATDPSYLRTAQDGAVKNYRDWGIALGRRFRSLKVWFVLSALGVEGVRAQVRRHLALARWLGGQVDATPDWERLAPVPLQTVCFRHRPPGLEGSALDAHNLALARAVNASGRAYLTPAVVKGVQLLRVSVGATATTADDLVALWAQLARDRRGALTRVRRGASSSHSGQPCPTRGRCGRVRPQCSSPPRSVCSSPLRLRSPEPTTRDSRRCWRR